ncbi:hypothetical protein EU800_25850 [Tropicimonas sp. IMCC6043]|nr:hypothetical protein EU800_25850 [Tropicimonas sp. IMCC6043]
METQRAALEAAGCEKVWQEQVSSVADRSGLQEARVGSLIRLVRFDCSCITGLGCILMMVSGAGGL